MAIMFLKGNDIREIRKAAGMNQREFGELLGVADATVNRWELDKRRPNYDMMERLYALADKYLSKSTRKQFAGAK